MISASLALEIEIRRLHQAQDWPGAATTAIKGYGPEVLGFLVALVKTEEDAAEVFQRVCESLWTGIGGFGWRSSFRTWIYAIARHAAFRFLSAPARWRELRLSAAGPASALEAQVRTNTLPHLRTVNKDRVTRLRERLTPEEQALLVLRIDRRLAWREIAWVLVDPETQPTEEDLRRATVRGRKRFERITAQLRSLALQEGLLES